MARGDLKKKKYESNHRVNDENIIEKRCSICNEWKTLNEENFYKWNYSLDNFHPHCKICTRDKSRKYKSENKETCRARDKKWYFEHQAYIKEYNKKYVEENPNKKKEILKNWKVENKESLKKHNDKRRNKNHKLFKNEWIECKQYFNNSCAYCGISEEEHIKIYNQQLHKEHVEHEGNNNLSNCVPACRLCNSSKWKFEMETWYKEQIFFSEEKLHKIYKWLNEDYKIYINK